MEIVYETETDTFTFSYPWDILLGIVLRSPFTTLSTVLSDIASGLGVEVSSLGLLTSLPLLTFAISHLLQLAGLNALVSKDSSSEF